MIHKMAVFYPVNLVNPVWFFSVLSVFSVVLFLPRIWGDETHET